MLKLLKYLPTILAVIEAIGKLVDAFKSRQKAIEKKQNTEVEDKTIKKFKDRLIDIGHNFLPDDTTASVPEITLFTDKLFTLVEATLEAVKAFAPLTKP